MNARGQDGAGAAADEDLKLLHRMGYAQELARRLSRFSNFAISFSIICILSGAINSLAQATSGAGGAAIEVEVWALSAAARPRAKWTSTSPACRVARAKRR